MYDTVLIATDGSEESEPIVENALDMAEMFDAEVHAIFVVETKANYILTMGISEGELENYRAMGQEIVDDVVARAESRGLDGKGVVRTGKIADEVSEYASEADVDGVFIGERGHGKTIDKYVGSNTEKIVRQCSKPVTIIRV
ncbi:MAG: universal stress protein [Halodesulfurarchaeum sp.]|nr:universal stress protein [Halodesulfurarchaeum sp.]